MDWYYAVPKLVFVLPVAFVILWVIWEKIQEAAGRGKHPVKYEILTFALIAAWLGSEALELLMDRLANRAELNVQRIERAISSSHNDIVQTIQATQGGAVVRKGAEAIFEGLSRDIANSREKIDVISWGRLGDPHQEDRAKQMFTAFVARANDKNRAITLRRLLWSPQQLDFLERHRQQYDGLDNVEMSYLTEPPQLPITPCVVIDGSIVHCGLGYLGDPSYDDVDIVITDSSVADVYQSYFKYLWSRGVKVKEQGAPISDEAIRRAKSGSRPSGSGG